MRIKNDSKKIRNGKIARIWVLARDLGIDGDEKDLLYIVVHSTTGSDSISKLSLSQLNTVIAALEKELEKDKRHEAYEKRKRIESGVIYIPSTAQKELVDSLLKQITVSLNLKYPTAYLEAICKRSFKKDYRKLSGSEIQSLIEALKSISHRKNSAV